MVEKGLNTHVSGVKADIILSTTLPITPIIPGDCFERGAFSERPSAAALKVCSQVFLRGAKWAIIPCNHSDGFPEAEEFSLDPKEQHLNMYFCMIWKVYLQLTSPLFWLGTS